MMGTHDEREDLSMVLFGHGRFDSYGGGGLPYRGLHLLLLHLCRTLAARLIPMGEEAL